jgi:hypothetical protein
MQQYEVALEAQRIRFSDSFENLICLPNLQNVQSLWYQEETARKVLKHFGAAPCCRTRWVWEKPSRLALF